MSTDALPVHRRDQRPSRMRAYGMPTALVYDVGSAERPVYRKGRLVAIAALGLQPGDIVLDAGVGTGLSLPLIARRIGADGTIVAVDYSRAMLWRSAIRARRGGPGGARRAGWPEIRLLRGDLTRADPQRLLPDGRPIDAALAINTLSLIADWRAAWRTIAAAVRPGGRIGVADIGAPERCRLRGVVGARLIAAIGGSDLAAHPWTAVEEECTDVTAAAFWAGHVQVRVGRLPG